MKLAFAIATETDAPDIARLSTLATIHLLEKYRRDTSKCVVKETSVLYSMKTSRFLIARLEHKIIAALRLAKKRPWAIDAAYFTKVPRPLYLTNMAVAPEWQRQGVGRQILEAARAVARKWPGDAIRLDAYDNETGAGGFYEKCGFREVGRATFRRTPLIYFELLL